MLLALDKTTEQVEILNVGSDDQTSVKQIADTVTNKMGLKDVEYHYTGGSTKGLEGGREEYAPRITEQFSIT